MLTRLQRDENITFSVMIKKLMHFFGFWLYPDNRRKHALGTALAVISTLMCFSQLVTLCKSLRDMLVFIECLSVISFCCMAMIKLTALRACPGRWAELVAHVHALERQQRPAAAPTADITKISNTIKTFYFVSGTTFVLTPFIEYSFIAWAREQPGPPHVLPVWSPFDAMVSVYLIVAVLEIITCYYFVAIHVSFDVTCIGLMIFISDQFSVLRRDMQLVVGGTGDDGVRAPSREKDLVAPHNIIHCHAYHLKLMRMVKILDGMLSPIMGVYMNVVTMTLCAIAFQLTFPLSNVQKLSLAQYLCANLVQLFLYCRYGDLLLHQSDVGQGEGALGAAWWELSPRMRRGLLLLAVGSSRPLRLNAGLFHQLNLPSFLTILQKAYSFYAVLRSTDRN